jgi:hypothetical protein
MIRMKMCKLNKPDSLDAAVKGNAPKNNLSLFSFLPRRLEGGADWSLDILLAENDPIPKGLYHSAQGCERRATLSAHGEMNRLPCKGCITAPTDAFSPPCRNHWRGFSYIPSSPPKSAALGCVTSRYDTTNGMCGIDCRNGD